MKDNKEKKQSIWNLIRDAGFGFIPMVIVSIICIGWMHYCEGGYYLVKKDHCIAINDSAMIFLAGSDSANIVSSHYLFGDNSDNSYLLTKQEPKEESKGSYLSLWAATLAVIFVVFSIFGVLKLELTKKDIEEKLDDVKKLEENLSKLNKIQTAYQNYSVQIEASVNDNNIMRETRLHNLVSILDDYADNIEEERYNTIFELYMGILNMKTINENEHERYMRAEWILDRIDKENYKCEQHLYLLGKCYYYKYKEKGLIKYLEHSLDAFCILCQEQNIYGHWQEHHYKYERAQFNRELYLYDLCQVLYVYPESSDNPSNREYALDEASRLIENAVCKS